VARPNAEDDLLPGLPPLEGGDEPSPELELDDELDAETEDGEEVGLDADTGLDGSEDEAIEDGDEDEPWTVGSEESNDLDDGDEDFGPEDAATWTAADEAAPLADDDDDDLTEEDGEPAAVADRGEEGLDDDEPVATGTDDDSDLPAIEPLASLNSDEGSDELEVSDAGDLDGLDLADEHERRLEGTSLPRHPDDGSLAVSYLGPEDDSLACVARAGDHIVAGGFEGLYRAGDSELVPLDAEGLSGEGTTSIVIDAGDPQRIAVGTRLGGVMVSGDGGSTFDTANDWRRREGGTEVALYVAIEPCASGSRLWARTRSGALYRSEDFGATWAGPLLLGPARALAVDAAGGGVVVLTGGRGAAQIARSTDGGARWLMRDAPSSAASGGAGRAAGDEPALAAHGDVLVVAHEGDAEGPHISHDGGVSWARLGELAGAGVVALGREVGGVALYAGLFFAGADRGVLVRRGADGVSAVLLDVAAERDARSIEALGDAEGDNRVLALDVRVGRVGTTVLAATGAGLFRLALGSREI
jgi:hypothetical protein